MKKILENFLKLFFPPACAACRKPISAACGADMLCAQCLADIEKVVSPICTVCGTPFISSMGPDHICAKCMEIRPVFDSARALFIYRGTVKKLIHRTKFQGDGYALRALCILSGQAMTISDFSAWSAIVPVPLHISRLRSRGFNQAVSMARRLLPRNSINTRLLSRTRNTRPQMYLSVAERRANIRGAFSVGERLVEGDGLLLFDDIFTTGSTVESAAAALKNAGAGRVDVLTLTCAVKRGRQPDSAGIFG